MRAPARRRVDPPAPSTVTIRQAYPELGIRWVSPTPNNTYHGRGDYDDRTRNIWTVQIPTCVNGRKISCLVLAFAWRDQGWGNRKSMLYLGDCRGQDELVPLSTEVADHNWQIVQTIYRPRDNVSWWNVPEKDEIEDDEAPDQAGLRSSSSVVNLPVSGYIGGGGGHELFVHDFYIGLVPASHVPELFYVLRQVRSMCIESTRGEEEEEEEGAVAEQCNNRLFLGCVAKIPDGPLMLILSYVGHLDNCSYLEKQIQP